MFLHIGGNISVHMREIVSIHSLNDAEITKEFLDISTEEGFVEDISDGEGKSFVIIIHDNQQKIYISPISAYTLGKRAGFIREINILNDYK